MRSAVVAGLPRARFELWPARPRAEVVFSPGEQLAVERFGIRWFGQRLEGWQYGGVAGAPDWARVEVGYWRGGLSLELDDPVSAVCRAMFHLYRTGDDLVLRNDGLRIRSCCFQGRGLGTQMFHRQLLAATALGIARIELTAGRNDHENGYYTWPRFGFDGCLPEAVVAALPAKFGCAHRVLDLIESRQGLAWWRQHGVPLPVAFDVGLCSRSRRVFDRYLRIRSRFAPR